MVNISFYFRYSFEGANGITPLTTFLCPLYFNTSSPVCDGAIVAINGENGLILWTTWLHDTPSQIHCQIDFDLDGAKDCVITGKSTVRPYLYLLSHLNGKLMFPFKIRLCGQSAPCLENYCGAPEQINYSCHA